MKRSYFSLVASIVIVLGGALSFKESSAGYSTVKEVRITTGVVKLDLSEDSIVRVPANSEKGFDFPYYLFVPRSIPRSRNIHMLVEGNNTGKRSDDLEIHDQKAKHQTTNSQIAKKLNIPLLVPVFPRPDSSPFMYTHQLDEDTLLVKTGLLKRIDLQLIEMIKDAQELLRTNSIKVNEKVFMHGFSASGTFANRFAILHPRMVRAVAAGGINCIPTFPTTRWQNATLRYPVGIADLKEIAGIDFDEKAYKQVSQYIYMGYLDRNDTIPYGKAYDGEAYDKEDAELIKTLIGAEMPKRWQVSQSIYQELEIPAQFVTYNDTGHRIRSEMIDDIVKFFTANSGDAIVEIEPHQYPFVEYRELQEVHINGVYWKRDKRIPKWGRDLLGGGSFIISIEDWIEGQDRQQLNIFRRNAGFNFVLKADGYEDISVSGENFCGTMSMGEGSFQACVVRLSPSQLEKMASAVEYTIVPINENKKYIWKVNMGVRLIKPNLEKFDLSQDLVVRISADTQKGFNFPYYLFVPRSMNLNQCTYILVETNNTGQCSDDFEIHDQSARRLAENSHAHKMAEKLKVPLLVPVFPRPQSQWWMYTHALDEDTLLVMTGSLKRIDLQLIEMIKDAQELLKKTMLKSKARFSCMDSPLQGPFRIDLLFSTRISYEP